MSEQLASPRLITPELQEASFTLPLTTAQSTTRIEILSPPESIVNVLGRDIHFSDIKGHVPDDCGRHRKENSRENLTVYSGFLMQRIDEEASPRNDILEYEESLKKSFHSKNNLSIISLRKQDITGPSSEVDLDEFPEKIDDLPNRPYSPTNQLRIPLSNQDNDTSIVNVKGRMSTPYSSNFNSNPFNAIKTPRSHIRDLVNQENELNSLSSVDKATVLINFSQDKAFETRFSLAYRQNLFCAARYSEK